MQFIIFFILFSITFASPPRGFRPDPKYCILKLQERISLMTHTKKQEIAYYTPQLMNRVIAWDYLEEIRDLGDYQGNQIS
jgi:hypothetical protein